MTLCISYNAFNFSKYFLFFYRENICSPNIGMHSLYYSLYHIYLFKVKSNGWMQKKFQKSWNFGRVWWSIIRHAPLFRNKSFVPYKIFQRNNSKIMVFFNSSNFSFSLWMLWSGKMKKKTRLYMKYSKFCSFSLERLVEHKPLICEEWHAFALCNEE